MKSETTTGGCLAQSIGFLAILFAGALIRGFAFFTLWRWVCVESLHMKPISYAAAVGLVLIANMLTQSSSTEDWKEKTLTEIWAKSITLVFIVPFLSLGLAWLILRLAHMVGG